MLKLDVPFVPDGEYPDFLAQRSNALGCVHFSLYDPALSDARQRLERKEPEHIVAGLNRLENTPRYALMNSRLHVPDAYFSKERLTATGERLHQLVEEAGLTGIIFTDFFYLQAISDAHPDLVEKIEAVPSINTLLSSAERVFAALRTIEATRFRPPSRFILDRSLNRNMHRLETVTGQLRHSLPDVELYVMANEGCLYECPYKLTHDAHIALVNEGVCGERTFAMNRDLGCIRRMLTEPGGMLASPFIRPEDMDRYDGLVHGVKLCGRNRGIEFLQRTVTAYLDRTYAGNLLDLMEAMGDLADRVELPNDAFPREFFNRVTICDKHCTRCGWCAETADRIVERRYPGLPSMK